MRQSSSRDQNKHKNTKMSWMPKVVVGVGVVVVGLIVISNPGGQQESSTSTPKASSKPLNERTSKNNVLGQTFFDSYSSVSDEDVMKSINEFPSEIGRLVEEFNIPVPFTSSDIRFVKEQLSLSFRMFTNTDGIDITDEMSSDVETLVDSMELLVSKFKGTKEDKARVKAVVELLQDYEDDYKAAVKKGDYESAVEIYNNILNAIKTVTSYLNNLE